jgi:hypothetical protein
VAAPKPQPDWKFVAQVLVGEAYTTDADRMASDRIWARHLELESAHGKLDERDWNKYLTQASAEWLAEYMEQFKGGWE